MRPSSRESLILAGAATVIGTGLIAYCLTWSFAWDEGFHLLAAQLILRGMRPYLDFFHPQTPLYAYWNSFWMRIFGDTWRTAHVASAVCSTIAAYLVGDYVLRRFDLRFENANWAAWKLPCALAAAAMTGLNSEVLQFGTIGQGYGVCLLGVTAAFRLAVVAVDRKSVRFAAGAGFFAAAAAASSLLTAPMAPVILIWIVYESAAGNRLRKIAAFLAAGVIPFLPLFLLFVKSPFQVLFGAVKFHLFYRTVDWSGSIKQNLDVAGAWLNSAHAMLLLVLVVIALVVLSRNAPETETESRLRRELRLCIWLAAVEGAYLMYVRPSFPRYYLFVVPFVSIVAVIGMYAVGTRIGAPDKPWWGSAMIMAVMILGAAKTIDSSKTDYHWKDWEEIGQKVDEVTKPGAMLAADEEVYFVTRRIPPPGMEYGDTHKLRFSGELSEKLHIFSKEELERRIKAGMFATVVNCDDQETWDKWDLPKNYQHKEELSDCAVFWGKK